MPNWQEPKSMTGRALLFLSLGAMAALGLGVSMVSYGSVKAQNVSTREPASAITNRATSSLPVGVVSGEALFEKRCSNCHELDEHDRGPALRDVYGRIAGHEPGFRYSQALSSRFFNWDEANLDIWLQGPGRMVPGARMRVHVTAPAERTAIIAYLKSVNPSPSQSEPRP
jgi:cytochrome c